MTALVIGALALAGAAWATPPGGLAGAAQSAASCSRTRQFAYVATNLSEPGPVWVAAADGSGRQRLLRGATPELSPNGRMLAVTDFGHAAGLGVFTVCGELIRHFFSAHDAVSGVAWSPDSSLMAAIVNPHPNGSAFGERLVVINVPTGQTTTVARGFLSGWGEPSFSPTSPYAVAYDLVAKVAGNPNVWSATVGQTPTQLTARGMNEYPVWGVRGIVYERVPNSGGPAEVELESGGHSTPIMHLNGWPVAVSSDGTHLAAEGAACGDVWSLSVDLSTRKLVHRFPDGFAPFGISPSGRSLLIAGSPPAADCGGRRSVIETVPFGGGRPRVIAYGSQPDWADSTG